MWRLPVAMMVKQPTPSKSNESEDVQNTQDHATTQKSTHVTRRPSPKYCAARGVDNDQRPTARRVRAIGTASTQAHGCRRKSCLRFELHSTHPTSVPWHEEGGAQSRLTSSQQPIGEQRHWRHGTLAPHNSTQTTVISQHDGARVRENATESHRTRAGIPPAAFRHPKLAEPPQPPATLPAAAGGSRPQLRELTSLLRTMGGTNR